MRLWVVAALALYLGGSMAFADEYQTKATCSPIADEAARKACFERGGVPAAGAPLPGCRKPVQLGTEIICMDESGTTGNGLLPPNEPAVTSKAVAAKPAKRATPQEIDRVVDGLPTDDRWSVRQEVSKISDTVNIYLTTESTNQLPDDRGGTTPALLIIRCKDDVTDVMFSIGDHWFYGEHYVKSRVDKKKAREKLWDKSTSNSSVFHPDPIGFAKELSTAKTLLIETAPINSNLLLAEFDIAGLDKAIKPLRMACGW